MIQNDPGMNALDWVSRGALMQGGLMESTTPCLLGPQTWFAGGAGDPLVFLHGVGDHAGSWARVAPAFTATHRVIVPDCAGRGTSHPFHCALGMDTMLTGLDAVLNAGAPDSGRITLVGNSLGAWVAMAWAAKHPERVLRVVLVNGGPVKGLRSDLSLAPGTRDQARRLWEAITDSANHAAPDVLLDELIRKGKEGAIARVDLVEMQPYLMDGQLSEFTTPVDLIWGESDRLIPLEYARNLAAALPRARLTTIPRCGHIPQLECTALFTEALRDVLNREPLDLKP